MANFNNIKHEIDQNVNTNGVQAITGAILNETLKDMIDEVDAKKQDTLVAGQNITIQGNVISATGGGSGETYTAGHGIDISSDNEISVDTQELAGYGLNNTDYQFNVDTSVIQGKLTAGANIQINGDTISATDTNTTYSAGSGLSLSGTTFSVDSSSLAGSGLEVDEFGALKTDPSLIQDKLTAGDGIEIDGSNEISVKAGTGLSFDSNGYLINTGGGGGGTTYTAGDGIEIDSNDAINAKLGNGLQLDGSNNIEVDTSVVATQNDLAGKQDTLTEGQGINIDSNNVISVDPSELAGNGLQVNQSGYLEPDFSVVATQSDLLGKQDTLVAGANITINGNTISATDTNTTYSAGNGLNLNGTTFSVDTNAIQEKLTAGTGISINGTTISATGGGGGSSYSAGDGINIDSNNTISVDASDLAGAGLLSDLNNNLSVDANDLAGNGLQVDANGRLEVVGGSGGSLWTTGAGTESRISSPNIAGTAAGDYAIAGGFNPTATGDYSFAFGNRPTVSGDNGVAIGYQPTAGIGSVALGYVANASGQNSFAAGHNVSATGTDSTAIGPSASASAGYATAIGNAASATGTGSVAIGSGTQTTTSFEQAFGKYNLSNNSASDDAATAYTIGNGTSVGARSNSIEIKKNDDIYVVGVGGFDGTNASSSQTLQDVINNGGGGGNYLPLEGGQLQADQSSNDTTLDITSPTNRSNISLDSYDNLDPNDPQGTATITMTDSNGYIQIKPNGVSDGTYTASWPTLSGDTTLATLSDITSGLWESGSGNGSIKNVEAASANGDHAFVAGYNAHADGNYSVALGARANASYANSFAIGADAVASQSHAFAIGKDANSSASYAYAIGRDASSSASYAAAIGRGVQATNQNEVGLGVYNKSTTGSTSDDNSKFTIGNGTGNAARSNVLEIKENGDAYLYGVGGFTGANTSAATTLQDVINNGGGGSSYSAGSGIDITNNTISVDTTTIQEKLTAGSNITISGNVISATGGGGASYSAGSGIDITNNTISVDNTIATKAELSGYLPLTGGQLQNSASEPDTRLELTSPKRGDCSIIAYANEIDSETSLSLNSSSISEREPGLYASNSDLMLSSGGQTGLDLFASASYVEDNGTFTLDEFYSSTGVFAPDGAAEILLETNSSSLSDPGNETREARIGISDDRGSIELNPTGFSDGTYTLGFPTLSQDETIATLSDIPSASSLAGDGLQDDGNGALEVKLGSGLQFDANGAIETTGGGGGSSYSAGTGISISAQNVISNTAPGLWIAGTGTNAVVPPGVNASSASGTQSIVLGTGMAQGNYSIAGATGIAHSPYSIALGYNSESGYNAITGQRSIALGTGVIAVSNDEVGVGIYNKSYNNSSTSIANIFSVGTGGDVLSRHNALEIKKNDDIYVSGVGGFDGTNYSSASTLQTVLSGKQDTLTAGTGITITNNVISATGGGGGGSLWTSGTGTDSLVAPGTVSSGLSQDPASGNGAISCGYDTTADGAFSFASGGATVASGDYSFAANNSTAAGNYSAAFGAAGAKGTNSFAAVSGSADADYSVALAGGQVVYDDTDPNNIKNAQYGVAIGDGSVVEGEYGLAFMGGAASGSHSVAIGDAASATEMYSTALTGSTAQGNYSFAASTGVASGHYSSALSGSNALGEGSLASGFSTSAHGYCSAALGYALSTYSQADGALNTDPNAGEVALGRYNYSEAGIVFTVGCGYLDETDPDNPTEVRQNAVAIDSTGKIYLKGLGGYTGTSTSGCTDLVSFLSNL